MLWGFFGNGIAAWQSAFFLRRYHLTTREPGTTLGLVQGLSYLVGTYFGGKLAMRFARNDERRQLIGIGIGYVLVGCLHSRRLQRPHYSLALAKSSSARPTVRSRASSSRSLQPRIPALAVSLLYLATFLVM